MYLSSLLDIYFAKVFSQSDFLFILLVVSSSSRVEVFYFLLLPVTCLFFYGFTSGFGSKQSLSNPGSPRPFPMFFWQTFYTLSFTFRSITHFELIFVYGTKYGSKSIFYLMYFQLQCDLLGKVCVLHSIAFVKNQLFINMWGLFLDSLFCSVVYLSVFT